MLTKFQINDPSIESQWRALILFGKNSATYKFAFAKSLLVIIEEQKTKISLTEMAIPFADSIIEHLKKMTSKGIPLQVGFCRAAEILFLIKSQKSSYIILQKNMGS